ncbi:polysaccharide biosynthesis tyrosine autokinase [Mesorhizobium sp. CAU 1741]|uniref:polysaccharide biosynthesis tyrosine autokinase n=1 Tax=Mesorhizobium sp. CAU 1741 TaxID=3140366 RepID=UPI00325B1E0E
MPHPTNVTPLPPAEDTIDVERLLLIARRNALVVAMLGFIGLCLAVVYALNAQPLFSASAEIILGGTSASREQGFDSSVEADTRIAGQIELLRSTRIALKVVDDIGIEAFNVPVSPSVLAMLRTAVRTVLRPYDEAANYGVVTEPKLAAALSLQRSIYVQRVGRSPTITIAFTSPDPELAARVPNAYASAYVADQEEVLRQRADESIAWLEERMQGLRQDLFEADLAAEAFRAANGLAQPGGQLISERMIIDLNQTIVAALSQLGEVKARSAQLDEVIDSTDPVRLSAIPADILTGDTGEATRTLKDNFAAATARHAEIVARSGTDHPEAIALSAQLDLLRERLVSQLLTIQQQVSDGAEIASGRVDYLRQQLADAIELNKSDTRKMIELSNLQQTAESYRTLLASYLDRYHESTLVRSAPHVTAQVISPANRPIVPVSPRKMQIVLIGLLLGLMAGAVVAVLREYRERYYRTGEQLTRDFGTEFLGSLPTMRRGFGWSLGARHDHALFKSRDNSLKMWIDKLHFDTAETLRRVLLICDQRMSRRKPKVIGVVSALPGEGKTTFAINLGRRLANSGKRTVLIDVDFRKPGIAGTLTTPPLVGLVELLMDESPLEAVMQADKETGLSVIPVLHNSDTQRIGQLIASSQMDSLLEELGELFDYVVIDLPPMGVVADARALASRIDGFFLVVRWGHTPRRLVQDTVFGDPTIYAKLLGTVLNRVNTRRIRRYLTFGSSELHREEYMYYAAPSKRK